MENNSSEDSRLQLFARHPREWENNAYVYPVISRRCRGLSIGVNLSPNRACNYNCIYCQVDRNTPAGERKVDLERLREELGRMLAWAANGSIFENTQFADIPADLKRVNDIAFSGDGEPTICSVFPEAVSLAAELKSALKLPEVKIILLTGACYLNQPNVAAALEVMGNNNGEIWAKLDAGTDAYFKKVNRTSFSLEHVVENTIKASRLCPLCIQSLFMRIDKEPPSDKEIEAYVSRLNSIRQAGGEIRQVQVYSIARQPAEAFVTSLPSEILDDIADRVKNATGLDVVTYH